MTWKIRTINRHSKCKSIIIHAVLLNFRLFVFSECVVMVFQQLNPSMEIDNSVKVGQFSPDMRHHVPKIEWNVWKTCLSTASVIPLKYSYLYLSLLRFHLSRVEEQTGNLKHYLLCSLMITLRERSTTFSSLGGLLVMQPSCRKQADFLRPSAVCAGGLRSVVLKCWRRKTRHLKDFLITTALYFYWY